MSRHSRLGNYVGPNTLILPFRSTENLGMSVGKRRTKVTAGVPPTNTRGFTIGVPFHLCLSFCECGDGDQGRGWAGVVEAADFQLPGLAEAIKTNIWC